MATLFRRILVPHDFSQHATRAGTLGRRRARRRTQRQARRSPRAPARVPGRRPSAHGAQKGVSAAGGGSGARPARAPAPRSAGGPGDLEVPEPACGMSRGNRRPLPGDHRGGARGDGDRHGHARANGPAARAHRECRREDGAPLPGPGADHPGARRAREGRTTSTRAAISAGDVASSGTRLSRASRHRQSRDSEMNHCGWWASSHSAQQCRYSPPSPWKPSRAG